MAEDEQAVELKNTVTVEDTGPCRKKVIIEVPEQRIRQATDEQYETLRKEVVLPGFRRGRAPRRLLERRFGKDTTEQIKLKLLAEATESALKDSSLDALREPDVDFEEVELPGEGPLKFDFEVNVRPEFDLPPLEGIPVTRTKLEATDEQVDREIEKMQRWAGVWTPREEGEVELDDQIIADAMLKVEDVEEEEKLDNVEIFVRPNGFVGAVPVEELDKLLVGAQTGQTKQTVVEVPKTYFREQYRGKKVDVQITVKEVKWLKPAAVDENFLKRHEAEDEAELREKVRDVLRGRLEEQTKADMTDQVYEHLLENTEFDLPLEIVGDYSATLLRRQYSELLMRGLPREQIEERMQQLQASSEQQAKEQLRTYFIMDKVAEKLEIEVTEEAINGHIAQLAIRRGQRPERMREQMQRDGSLEQFRSQVRVDKCITRLLESATVTEVEEPKKEKKARKSAKEGTTSKSASSQKKPPRRKTSAKKKTDE
jgi:trigger factor